MPLMVLARLVTGFLGLVILGASAYLLWSWYDGETIRTATGDLIREREDWRLWTGLALLAWSFLGRFIMLPLLAKPDKEERFKPTRGKELTLSGATGELSINIAGPADGDVIVLTHGWGLDSSIWTRTREALAQRYRVIAWDLPGMGQSQGKVKTTQLDVFATDLERVIGLAQNARVVLVGHSIGGMTIQTLARRKPDFLRDRISGVVLVNTTHTNPLKTMWLSSLAQALRGPVLEPQLWLTTAIGPIAQLLAWQSYLNGHAHLANRLGFAGEVTRSELDATTRLSVKNRQDISAKGNLAMFRWSATETLGAIAAPTLVIGGGKDLVTKCEASRTIQQNIPGARLQVIDNANHMGFLEQPQTYTSAIENFVAKALSDQPSDLASQRAPSPRDRRTS